MVSFRHISFTLFAGALMSITSRGECQQHFKPATASADSSITKDTVHGPVLNDLKKGFRNLFVTSQLGDGVSSSQLNPQAITFVQDYMSRNSKGLKRMKDWGRPYFDMIDGILTQHGIPKELKYLAVIESGLKVNAISWAGAVGPWALMPGTARMYGMKVSRNYDERTDYFKSTHVAARLLKDLFAQYGDWLLVIAAYNGGPGNVDKAIRRSGSRDFWTLQHNLPNESKNHVKKFISTHYIMEGEGGVTTLTKSEVKDAKNNSRINLRKEELDSSRTQPISGRYKATVLIKHIGMDAASFNRYNPGFDSQVAANGKYELRLPNEKMDLFIAKKSEILNESLQVLLKQAGTN